MKDLFATQAMSPGNSKWEEGIKRKDSLYKRNDDIRSEFSRDYNRILHCTAYRRLKHKTQVFFATKNDHICTRIEHVSHVASISHTIAGFLGLNTELTNAIAVGHDLGHAPFGHHGGDVLNRLALESTGQGFWHEQNSLKFVDKIETLQDPKRFEVNLNLTYAVRDGIISHCGEVDENGLNPRQEPIDLDLINTPGKVPPYTWEGCVVKFADKISFLGRDIEDALALGLLNYRDIRELVDIGRKKHALPFREINNTVIIHQLIINLCETSSPKAGLRFSEDYHKFLVDLKQFCYKKIYLHSRLENFKRYSNLIIETIFNSLMNYYEGRNTINKLNQEIRAYPILCDYFAEWLLKYSDINLPERKKCGYSNVVIYNIEEKRDYSLSVLDFISGMTDNFALKIFDELTGF